MYNTFYSQNYESRNPDYYRSLCALRDDFPKDFEHLMLTGKLLTPPRAQTPTGYTLMEKRQWNGDAYLIDMTGQKNDWKPNYGRAQQKMKRRNTNKKMRAGIK